jgi:CHRD domain
VPAAAGQQFTTVRATLGPAGDPDGTGSALLELDAKDEAVCYEIHTQNVTTPITDAAIVSAETGEVAVELLVIDRGADLVECVSVSEFQGHGRRELRRIGKDPSGYFLELYNSEHPSSPGAVRGQLEGVS